MIQRGIWKNQNLLKLWRQKVSKFLCNIKTKWIHMVTPNKVVLEKFKILLVIIAQDVITNEFVIVNYELLCDIETVMGLTCLLPMLETLQGLSKYAHNK
jgi:hypothetical protein